MTVGGVVALRGPFSEGSVGWLASFGHDFGPPRGGFGVAHHSIWAVNRGQNAAQKGAAVYEIAYTILRPELTILPPARSPPPRRRRRLLHRTPSCFARTNGYAQRTAYSGRRGRC